MEALPVVISRAGVLIDQAWHIGPEGVRMEESGEPVMQLARTQIRGFGLPMLAGAGGTSHVLLAYQTSAVVELVRIPVLDGSVHSETGARRCYDALCRSMPEHNLGWNALPSADFHARAGISLAALNLAPLLVVVVLALLAAMALLFIALR